VNFRSFTESIERYRLYIILTTLFITVFSLYNLEPKFISSSESNWILGSEAHKELKESNEKQVFLTEFKVKLNSDSLYSGRTMEELLAFESELQKISSIVSIESIFTHRFIFEIRENGSTMVESLTLPEAIDSGVETEGVFLNSLHKLKNLIDLDNREATFYLYRSSKGEIEKIDTPLIYSYKELKVEGEIGDYTIAITLSITLFILLLIAFKQLYAPLIGTVFVVVTSSITISIFEYTMGSYQPHISIVILSFSVSLMDYIYIYYRWFLLQKSRNSRDALQGSMEKTFFPILFTTVINVLGIGSLILVSSVILKSLGLMVIISSIVGLILSFTLLPALLSYIDIKKEVKLESERVSNMFTNRVEKYSYRALRVFLFTTVLLFTYSIYHLYHDSFRVESSSSSDVIKMVLDREDINSDSLREMKQIIEALDSSLISKIESAYGIIKGLYEKESGETLNLADVDIDRYIFLMELSGDYENYYRDEKLKFDIYLNSKTDKADVLQTIRELKSPLIVIDEDSLSQSAKLDNIETLIIVLFFVITIIGATVIVMTGDSKYLLLAIYTNLIPLIWFFTAILVFDYPLSTEIFVAMIVSISLSSDATMHFIHFYNSNREAQKRERVENLILFVGSPLVLGNVVLALTFLLLIVANISTIALIGVFTSILILLSILTDIFILPVLFLEMDKRA
jgi:predicted RND superfamily exporter protein